MRENRTYGSEGGEDILPDPISAAGWLVARMLLLSLWTWLWLLESRAPA
jgi:hypothetical protein